MIPGSGFTPVVDEGAADASVTTHAFWTSDTNCFGDIPEDADAAGFIGDGDVDFTTPPAQLEFPDDFGNAAMDKHAMGADMFDVAVYPTATYKGRISKWNGDAPAEVDGQLTLKGMTKPLKLTIHSFLCKPNPITRKETCGADASGTFMRDAFNLDYGKSMGFKMDTKLLISIEAIKAE